MPATNQPTNENSANDQQPAGLSKTRIAPSPTGALHLGNARTFLANWAMARQNGWQVLLRIEDLDGPRIKAKAAKQAAQTLAWLGIDWDEGPTFQSHDLQPYHDALVQLAADGAIYPCRCTRSQILAASLSAPHADEHDLRYSGTCRPVEKSSLDFDSFDQTDLAWRLIAPDKESSFDDTFAGPQSHNVQRSVGDFVVATKAGLPSYQLAVVVDDARQGVTHIVRGDDLLTSTPRQRLLYQRLGVDQSLWPTYTHLPMVIGEDGRRLAKRHGDTRVDHYRQQGVPVERVIGLLAKWCGFGGRYEMTIDEFRERFSLETMPREAVVFTESDDQWLFGLE